MAKKPKGFAEGFSEGFNPMFQSATLAALHNILTNPPDKVALDRQQQEGAIAAQKQEAQIREKTLASKEPELAIEKQRLQNEELTAKIGEHKSNIQKAGTYDELIKQKRNDEFLKQAQKQVLENPMAKMGLITPVEMKARILDTYNMLKDVRGGTPPPAGAPTPAPGAVPPPAGNPGDMVTVKSSLGNTIKIPRSRLGEAQQLDPKLEILNGK